MTDTAPTIRPVAQYGTSNVRRRHEKMDLARRQMAERSVVWADVKQWALDNGWSVADVKAMNPLAVDAFYKATAGQETVGDRLTTRERAALAAIVDITQAKGYPPSLQEVGDRIGLSSRASVSYVLAQLVEKGFVRRDPKTPRSIVVVEPGP